MTHEYELVAEKHSYALWRREDGKFCVTSINRKAGQVYSVMPNDKPSGGGQWFARITPAGIDYVANGYSESYARRKFREFVLDR